MVHWHRHQMSKALNCHSSKTGIYLLQLHQYRKHLIMGQPLHSITHSLRIQQNHNLTLVQLPPPIRRVPTVPSIVGLWSVYQLYLWCTATSSLSKWLQDFVRLEDWVYTPSPISQSKLSWDVLFTDVIYICNTLISIMMHEDRWKHVFPLSNIKSPSCYCYVSICAAYINPWNQSEC